MAQAQGYIPQADAYTIPKGLTETKTPQGGTSFTDSAGTYGAAGSMYIKGVNGYTLAPSTLEGNGAVVNPTPSQGTATQQIAPQTPAQVSVQPAGTTIKTAPTTVAPAPTFDPMSQQGQALSKALEDAANGIGNAMGGVPSKATPKTDTAGNPLNADGTPVITHENFSLSDTLAKIGTAPTPPNANDLQAQGEAQFGIAGIRTNLDTLTQQYTQLQNELQNKQAGEASKPGVIATIVNGRMRMLSGEQKQALDGLKAQITDATTQLRNANTAVQTFMKNSQTDYANAEKQYEFAYNKAISVYQDEQNNENKAQSAAKANAQVIINSYKGSAVRADAITPDMEAQWSNLETQAGLPSGTIKAAVNAELNIEKFYKGNDGNMYAVQVVNGVPQTIKIGYAGDGKNGSGGLSPSEQKRVDSFTKDLANNTQLMKKTGAVTREQFIRQLQSKYPDINPDQISQAVYKTYPDSYNK